MRFLETQRVVDDEVSKIAVNPAHIVAFGPAHSPEQTMLTLVTGGMVEITMTYAEVRHWFENLL